MSNRDQLRLESISSSCSFDIRVSSFYSSKSRSSWIMYRSNLFLDSWVYLDKGLMSDQVLFIRSFEFLKTKFVTIPVLFTFVPSWFLFNLFLRLFYLITPLSDPLDNLEKETA